MFRRGILRCKTFGVSRHAVRLSEWRDEEKPQTGGSRALPGTLISDMRVDFMKRIDQWAGGFGCIVLDVVEFLIGRLRHRPISPERVRVVLITKYLGMGSIILAAPMIGKVRALYPAARVLFLTFRENRELAEMLGLFDEVMVVDSKRLWRLVIDTLAALWRLWRARVDVVCDLEFFARFSAMVAYLSGARIRAGYWSRIAWRGNLLTHPVYYNATKHITRVFLAQAEILGATIDESEPLRLPSLPHNDKAASAYRAIAAAAGLDSDGPMLLVNPNASELCLERRWMADRFAGAVSVLLSEHVRLRCAFIGASSEAAYTGTVVEQCRPRDRVANLAGRLSLAELAEALRDAALFLSNDSGPLHLATLVDTPCVAIFGPETPGLYGPIGARQKVFYAGVYCSPCLNVYNSKTAACNGRNVCVQAIGLEAVLEACRALLASQADTRTGRAQGAAVAAWR
jgi:ADP-heptose:LPS heptosyltransferase